MRFSLRRVAVVSTALVLVILLGALWACITPFAPVPEHLNRRPKFDAASYRRSDLSVRKTIHYSQKRDRWFLEYSKRIEGGPGPTNHPRTSTTPLTSSNTEEAAWVEMARQKPLRNRCNDFFSDWIEYNEDWSFEKSTDGFDKSIVDKAMYFRNSQDNMRRERSVKSQKTFELTKEDNFTINEKFIEAIGRTQIVLERIQETAELYRAFGRCYLKDDPVGDSSELFGRLSDKLVPYFTNKLPKFEDMEGKVTETLFPGREPIAEGSKVIQYIKENVSGRGIVISATTKYGREIMKMIRVLRALNNRLPIQIVHKGDISKKAKDYLLAAAQSDVEGLLNPDLSLEYSNVFPDMDLKEEAQKVQHSTFPKQDITFVNIKETILKDFKYNFSGYANKLLALFFTSFEEAMVLDADTVPLVAPEDIMDLDDYRKHGAFFFKDRTIRDYNDYLETNFFTQLMPTSPSNSIDSLLGIKPVTEHTLGNSYMTGWRHLMEAGMVTIDKSKHFLGLLMTLPLTLWKEPISSSTWGDKELYWLGLSIAGDEEYVFNKFGAAGVGMETTEPKYKLYFKSEAHEVCLNHPGHVYKDGRLLWINSGFSFCKKNGQFGDRLKYPFNEMEKSEREALYGQPLRVSHAVVPPPMPPYRQMGSPIDDTPEMNTRAWWKLRPQDFDEINEKVKDGKVTNQMDWNPQKGWVKSAACKGYYYCAYDVVSSYYDDNKVDRGDYFAFSPEEVRRTDFLAKMWVTGTTKLKASDYIPAKDEQKS